MTVQNAANANPLRARKVVTIVLAALLAATSVHAQTEEASTRDSTRAPLAQALSRAAESYRTPESRPPLTSPQVVVPQRSTKHKVAGALLGAVVGFPFGGFIGSKIEGNSCHCADAGLDGFIIGSQVGTAAGIILGYLFY